MFRFTTARRGESPRRLLSPSAPRSSRSRKQQSWTASHWGLRLRHLFRPASFVARRLRAEHESNTAPLLCVLDGRNLISSRSLAPYLSSADSPPRFGGHRAVLCARLGHRRTTMAFRRIASPPARRKRSIARCPIRERY